MTTAAAFAQDREDLSERPSLRVVRPSERRTKDPERVRLGRLGAYTQHATGRTNVGPARAAWLAGITAEVDPAGDLSPAEVARRSESAMRVRMTRLAMARWGKVKRTPDPVAWR